ncbi:hypothetical protein, partial [Escherichia coli]|uniref:hypothetical protein n=1 Tax=Escherichia coli TaxID=562 RepID=UPI001AD919FD
KSYSLGYGIFFSWYKLESISLVKVLGQSLHPSAHGDKNLSLLHTPLEDHFETLSALSCSCGSKLLV